MILYKNTASAFCNAVDDNHIVDDLENAFLTQVGHGVSPNEKNSWNNSLQFMERVIRKSAIPADSGILLEYNIPATSKRIDVVVSGHDEKERKNFVIIELKQWSEAEATDMDFLVRTYVGGGKRVLPHPAYQAYSYKQFLRDMNTAVADSTLNPYSCAYLHNYHKQTPEPLLEEQYAPIYEDTPLFFASDTKKLEKYLAERVGKGQGMEILDDIDSGKVRPSKKFIEYVADMLDGNPVYTLLDEQQVAYATILSYAIKAAKRTTIIVNGGPGTGKSVVAMNAFVALLKKGKNIRFVAPNAAFRLAMVDTLGKGRRNSKKRLNELFMGSSAFAAAAPLSYDAILVDEAHRLKAKGAYMYKGEGQVEDIIRSSMVNIFFIDDHQRIRLEDEGSVALIKAMAQKYGSEVHEVKLEAQFRCAGAEGFLNWVEHTLQIRDTANFDGWDKETFEFQIMDSPLALEKYIQEKNQQHWKARMLAGYAWHWSTAKEGNPDAEIPDVCIPEFNFARPWNSRKNSTNWAIDPNMQNQVGCVHPSQGLEFDYVGVIIGKDLIYNPETYAIEAVYKNYCDATGKKGLKNKPEELTKLIKNIYRILLSRGMRGCAVYCCDKNLQEYLKSRLKNIT